MKSTRGEVTKNALNDVAINLAIEFPSNPKMHQKVTISGVSMKPNIPQISVDIPKLDFALSDKGWHFIYRIIILLIANMATPKVPEGENLTLQVVY